MPLALPSHDQARARRTRSATASIAAVSVALTGAVTASFATSAVAETGRIVTLVGELQSELGCPGDWQPDCAETRLAPTDQAGVYSGDFTVPGGTYLYKFAFDNGWDNPVPGGFDNLNLSIAGEANLRFTFDDNTDLFSVTPLDLAGEYSAADDALVAAPVRQPGSDERFYFVMADRFQNGDPTNDRGDWDPADGDSRLVHGFDPTDRGFYNGGDLRGLINELDYIEGLGTTAIWLTPSFKNLPVQGIGTDDVSAGYHGYWVTDFTQIDPHLGTNEELDELIAEAGDRGIKIYFDIITNHTADVIDYAEGEYHYIFKNERPYKDADGNVFDPDDFAGTGTFPALDPAISFPRTPFVREGMEDIKVPEWLNDVTLYHNRGNIAGDQWDHPEATTYGDFFGLDDLMTEHPQVVNGFVDVYKYWINKGVAGFRIDTVKHVNFEFWEEWTEKIADHAPEDFFMFGEVYSANPNLLAPYVRDTDMSSVLDFAYQASAQTFATGGNGSTLQRLFAGDDLYTTLDSSAYALPTFLGNHDMGRIGYFVRDTPNREQASQLAHSLMYLTRGQPVVYYGDEQGFMGTGVDGGGDKSARQSLFAPAVPEYTNQQLLNGQQAGAVDRFDTDTVLYEHIASLAALRDAHPALAQGAQIEQLVERNLYGFSRVDRDEKVEYVVVANNGTSAANATLTTLTPGATFAPLLGGSSDVTADGEGALTVSVPAQGVVVLKADRQVAAAEGLDVQITAPAAGAALTGLAPITADVTDNRYVETSFSYRVVGSDTWTPLGTSDRGEPRVFHDVRGLARGTLIEYRAVSVDAHGTISADSDFGSVGLAVDGVPPREDEPDDDEPFTGETVNIPGNHQQGLGCADNWQPACAATQMTERADGVWEAHFDDLAAGTYEFKIAVDGSWDWNYGKNWKQDGPNLGYTHAGGAISFYFDPVTKYFFNTSIHPVMTLPGSYQSEVGCPGDWQPDCLRTMLKDLDGDGIFTHSTKRIPEGTYEVKVAYGMSWAENYGAGGARDGANYSFESLGDGSVIEFRFDPETKLLTIGGPVVGITGKGQSAAHWVGREHLVLPTSLLGDTAARDMQFALHHAAEGGIRLDGETPVLPEGAGLIGLTVVDGLPEAIAKKFPHLATGHVVLKIDGSPSMAVLKDALSGQLVVTGSVDDTLRVFTGVQIPGVIDDLYAPAAANRQLGATFKGAVPSFALWAPTAKDVKLLVWQYGDTSRTPLRIAMKREDDGSWTAPGRPTWKNGAYLYEVTVYAPSTGKVEVNRVTDPYSVGLTLNSTHSVAVDLKDPAFRPQEWENTRQPRVRPVDQTIYELHVRDFSINDESVPEEKRGTYAAFAEEDTAGRNHLRQLAEAGMTTVHLLPTFDIATIEEDRAKQAEPDCDLASFAPDSEQQQACIDPIKDKDGFNWGYDPLHYTTPEGSYAVSAYGGARVAEFRSMVGALHEDGLQVVLDKVYNHTHASGQSEQSVLDRIVPGYYHRLNAAGQVEKSTCCDNVATEHAMAEKLMVDSVVTWARDYKVDGFRFDLMGHHSRANMEAIRAALNELTPSKDGVNGKSIYLYGEGWNFGEVANNARFYQATQGQLDGTGIGTFSDRLRDAVRGGGPFDDDPRLQGFGSGAYTDPNGAGINGTEAQQRARLAHQTDLTKLGLAGNLKDYTFVTSDGTQKRGDQLKYGDAPAGYASSPEETVTYVDAHDNETLFDSLTYKLPQGTPMEDRVRMNTLSLATTALAQTPSFWHAGTDLLRSKSLDRDSYNSGDWFNHLDWTMQDNGFGRGLPPAEKNQAKWVYQRPLLADPSLKPAPEHIEASAQMAQDLLRLRHSTRLFRLGNAGLIQQKVSFPDSGPDAAAGVIVMSIDDRIGRSVDPKLDAVLVVFNASDEEYSSVIEEHVGDSFALSPVQAEGADEVVKQTAWDHYTGTVTVPARTVAVLVAERGAGPRFSDVPPGHRFAKEIHWLADSGISTGYKDGSFRPNDSVTRGAMAAFLYRLENGTKAPRPTCTSAPFADISVRHAFCGEIAWMKEKEISTGYGDNTFRPNENVSRAAVAAFVARIEGPKVLPACTTAPFTDVSVRNRFCKEIQFMKERGLTTGYTDGTYRPSSNTSRSAMAAFLYRLAHPVGVTEARVAPLGGTAAR